MKDMKKYNGYDELSDRKQMQHWAGSKKFHDDNDKSIAKLEKEKEEKEKRKAKDFKSATPCYMKPSNAKITKKKVNENSVVKLNESQLRKIVAESVKKVLKENSFHSRDPFETSDAEVNLNKAIYELKETVNILERFCKDGMNEKRLLEMAQSYGERGMRLLEMAVSSAR